MQDLEADPDLRHGLNMYKNQVQRGVEDMETDEEDEDDKLAIPMDQLIDEMEDMAMDDSMEDDDDEE